MKKSMIFLWAMVTIAAGCAKPPVEEMDRALSRDLEDARSALGDIRANLSAATMAVSRKK
ncbi:MAG: hypothetical protein LBP32_05890 [Spirochaetaceae bacterium]|nr:hypothetical protein [Spirochaetaceae bacterium]